MGVWVCCGVWYDVVKLYSEKMMITVEAIEEAIKQLPQPDLTELQRWFADFYGDMWDKQIENDANSGKLDTLAAEALAEYNDGKATEF
jgi:hypothetical protein